MKKILILAMVLGLLVSGCATGPTHHWVKEGVTTEQFKADEFDCDYKSTTMASHIRDDIIRAIAINQNFIKCMESKGYRWEKIK